MESASTDVQNHPQHDVVVRGERRERAARVDALRSQRHVLAETRTPVLLLETAR